MVNFRILTLNIHKGFSLGNRRYTLESIRSKLRESTPNLVFLQEVIGENHRHRAKIPGWPEGNQFEFLADSVWDHFAYGKNAIYQHGHHGNAILSELPFSETNNIDVSTLRFSQRGILHGVLENGIHLLCIHFGLFESERQVQLQRLIEHIETSVPAGSPLILAGDFNDWRKTLHRELTNGCGLQDAHELIEEKTAVTYPAAFPLLPMDRIYVRGFQVKKVEVLSSRSWRDLSDHCALLAEVSLVDQDRVT